MRLKTGEGPAATVATELPADAVPILPLRNTVLFPGTAMPVTVGRAPSIQAVETAIQREQPLGVLPQSDPQVEKPGPEHLHRIGTLAEVQRLITAADGRRLVILRGRQRFRATEFLRKEPPLSARVQLIEEAAPENKEFEARFLNLRKEALRAVSLLPQEMPELAAAMEAAETPSLFIDLIASTLGISPAEKQGLLETLDLMERLRRVTEKLVHQNEVLELTRKIGSETREALDKTQRDYLLREQLKAIRKQLGEDDPRAAELKDLRQKIAKAAMPPEVEKEAHLELGRLEHVPEGSAEFSVIRTHLEWLSEMPWSQTTEEHIDLAEARAVLDADHEGLEKVKKRILEFLAVRKLKPEGKSPILCFVGPPGVGKTSLGRSIARATHRRFIRQSLGGVHDEAEIRGHRRTYVGALPGRIIQGIRKAGARNPVFMLDEVDKLSPSFHGDPNAALLEVLDPEQNSTFQDHYLDVPFDLSRVLFIATANVREAIPGPLLDRMEVIELPGYTEEEKLAIARRHLLGRQVEAHGLRPEDLRFADEALSEVIRSYTSEAGVRQLERELGAVCRAVAARFAEGRTEPVAVDVEAVRRFLGPPRFLNEVALRTSLSGVATGLAWTPQGGEILFVEATRMPGQGKLLLTGQLGEVMQESAQAALSLVKSRAAELGIPARLFRTSDLHLHLPSGAIPKDGPSAGITLFVALVSLLTGRRVRRDVAMTGEISLRGLVLPVGGIKEKVLAASRAGISRVLLPERNRKDLEDVPRQAREALDFRFTERVDQALDLALEARAAGRTSRTDGTARPGGRRRATAREGAGDHPAVGG